MILVLIFVSSSIVYVLSANLRLICLFTCLNYCHSNTIILFSMFSTERRGKNRIAKALHKPYTWNKLEENLAILSYDFGKE
jgi:hypothetical protein